MPSGVVLLGHGSKDAEGRAELLAYLEALRQRTGESVRAGVLEYPNPDLPDAQTAFAQAAHDGVDEVMALPALLHFAGHAKGDMPAQVQFARQRNPGLAITLAGPVGHDERLLQVVEQRLTHFEANEDAAVLLVGRGSTDPQANADLFKIARLLWDRNRFGWIEAAFVSLAPPGIAAGIDRCFKLGARRVIVMPYFLCTGVLVKRLGEQARQTASGVHVAPHLGVHELVVDILMDRLAQARAGMCACLASTGCRLPQSHCAMGALCLA
jgi:sirohydrochlorin cobaltochelatase